MIPETCICGNVLGSSRVKVVYTLCRCAKPGPGKHARRSGFRTEKPYWMSDEGADTRKRIGLPLETPLEKAMDSRMV